MIEEESLGRMAMELAGIGGVRAVVLGGSRARGTHTPDSDFDLGIYYDAGHLDVDALRTLAQDLSDIPVELAGPGEWGPWVDGGAWLLSHDSRVDWILRNTHQVKAQCDRALVGRFAFHIQPGHPLGFLDVSYAGEVALCRPLADPSGIIATLKATLSPYPDPLRRALAAHLWQASFLLDGATKAVSRGDSTYVALCCSSAALFCAHAWHAAAGVWVLNEKDLLPAVGRLPLDTGPFVHLVQDALRSLGHTGQSLTTSLDTMRKAVDYTRQRLG